MLPRLFSMRAARPTARPTHAVVQLFTGAADAPLTGCGPLRVLDPADELVASERGDVEPGIVSHGIRGKGGSEVIRKWVYRTTGESVVRCNNVCVWHTPRIMGR